MMKASPGTLPAVGLISVTEAAAKYGLSDVRIRQLLRNRTVTGTKFGPTWAVDEDSLKAYLATERKPGRKPNPS